MRKTYFLIIASYLIFYSCLLFYARSSSSDGKEPLVPPTMDGKPLHTISLKDGTVLKGQVVGKVNGLYVIKTPSMGEVQVPQDALETLWLERVPQTAAQVQEQPVRDTPAQTQTSQPVALQPVALPQTVPLMDKKSGAAPFLMNAAQMQQNLMADPEILSALQEITGDENLMKALNDGKLMEDMTSMDPSRMQGSPELQRLMQDPKVQEALQRIADKVNASAPQVTMPNFVPARR